jgi:hypothetical protein
MAVLSVLRLIDIDSILLTNIRASSYTSMFAFDFTSCAAISAISDAVIVEY